MGYVAPTTQRAVAEFYPGHARSFARIARERGYPAASVAQFEREIAPRGAYLIGDPQEVAGKILRHSDALGGIDRVTLQMDSADLPHEKLAESIELLGREVVPILRGRPIGR